MSREILIVMLTLTHATFSKTRATLLSPFLGKTGTLNECLIGLVDQRLHFCYYTWVKRGGKGRVFRRIGGRMECSKIRRTVFFSTLDFHLFFLQGQNDGSAVGVSVGSVEGILDGLFDGHIEGSRAQRNWYITNIKMHAE